MNHKTFFLAGIKSAICLACLVLALAANSQTDDSGPEAYRQVILQSLDILDQATLLNGNEIDRSALQQLYSRIQLMDAPSLELLAANGPPLSVLQARQQQSMELLQVAMAEQQNGAATRTIEFPTPQTSISLCETVTSTGTFVVFDIWAVIREILSATRWVCVQELAGFNAAEDCTVESVLDKFYEFEYLALDACLAEQRDAYLDTILETDENIADHLSDFVDATVSSLGSQDSVDDVQSDVTSNLSLLDDLDTSLSADLSSIEDDLGDVLDDLDTLSTDAISLASLASDIQFRVQENQVDVEDAQTSAAAAQSTAEEIRTDTQSIISDLTDLQSNVDSLQDAISATLAQSFKAAMVAVLANPDGGVIRYQLPASSGGELENIRELVIQTISAFDSLGIKVTGAQALLSQGDAAYNQQEYLTAYDFFAQAYQSLTDSGMATARTGSK